MHKNYKWCSVFGVQCSLDYGHTNTKMNESKSANKIVQIFYHYKMRRMPAVKTRSVFNLELIILTDGSVLLSLSLSHNCVCRSFFLLFWFSKRFYGCEIDCFSTQEFMQMLADCGSFWLKLWVNWIDSKVSGFCILCLLIPISINQWMRSFLFVEQFHDEPNFHIHIFK